MLKTFTNPFLLVPALLLSILLGVTVAFEISVDESAEQMSAILEDPIPALVSDLADATWDLEQTFYNFDTSKETTPQNDTIHKDIIAIQSSIQKIKKHWAENTAPTATDGAGLDLLQSISAKVQIIQDKTAVNENSDNESREVTKNAINDLVDYTQKVVKDTHFQQRNELHRVFDIFEGQEAWREFIAAITFVTFILIVSFAVRMTSRYRLENEKARNSERRHKLYSAILQSTNVAIAVRDMQDPKYPIVYTNNALTEMTGYAFNEVRDLPVGFLAGLHTDTESLKKLRSAFNNRETATIELLLYRKDNTPFWSEWHIGPVKQEDGTISHYFSIITDISAIRATQESLLLAKESAEKAGTVKGNFLASMSHEIRTPINGVLGVLELMADTTLDEEQTRLVSVATSSGRHLLEIINGVLDYSKIEAGKLEIEAAPCSLRSTIIEVLEMLQPTAAAKTLALTCSIAPETPDNILSDGNRIKQILLNLLSNAIKFTDQGSVELKVFSLMTQSDSGQDVSLIRFEVVDSGIGIGFADQQKLFSEFSQVDRSFTRRFGGTGLGLAITKQLVKLLNGEIGVESHPGKGSKFWFMLPLQQGDNAVKVLDTVKEVTLSQPHLQMKSVTAKEIVPAAVTNFNQKFRILLVEDNPVNQLVAMRYLSKAGFRADLAVNGLEAVKKAQEFIYDSILMDISMPEMDGLTATKEIRALKGNLLDVPIIAITAHVMRGDRERCIAAGMNDYLCKPLHYNSLCKVLARWIPAAKFDDLKDGAASPAKESAGATPSPADNIPIFDPSILERLAKDLDNKMVYNITRVFIDDFAVRSSRLLEKVSFGENRDIAREAHALKSSCAGCGLIRFSNLMREMEEAGNKDETERVQALANQIEKLYEASRHALIEGRKPYQDSCPYSPEAKHDE